ncbi:MAG: hypothetical protein FJ297_11685 [Planctomycetes bacterium]|nr:hypothetical protein [Planctomycetota bacterium]
MAHDRADRRSWFSRRFGGRAAAPAVLGLAGLAVGPLGAAGQDDGPSPRERLGAMTAAEKEELQRKERRFRSLSADEQDRLRAMHAEITEAPDADELTRVMTRYYEWLKTLRPGERAEVLSLPPEQRIEKIKGMLEEQSIQRFQRMAASQLGTDDVTLIFRWIGEYVARHDAELYDSLSEDQKRFVGQNPRTRRFVLTGALMRKSVNSILVSDDEVNQLIDGLSPTAKQILQSEKDRLQRVRIIRGWMEAAASSMFRNGGRTTPPPSNEQIMEFVTRELSARDRAFLEGLPAERFRREAERYYHWHKGRREREGGGGGAPPGSQGTPGPPGPQGRPGEIDRFRPFRPGGDPRSGPPRSNGREDGARSGPPNSR